MYCSKCGNEIPDDSAFCPKCGAKVIQESIQTEVEIQAAAPTVSEHVKENAESSSRQYIKASDGLPDTVAAEMFHKLKEGAPGCPVIRSVEYKKGQPDFVYVTGKLNNYSVLEKDNAPYVETKSKMWCTVLADILWFALTMICTGIFNCWENIGFGIISCVWGLLINISNAVLLSKEGKEVVPFIFNTIEIPNNYNVSFAIAYIRAIVYPVIVFAIITVCNMLSNI